MTTPKNAVPQTDKRKFDETTDETGMPTGYKCCAEYPECAKNEKREWPDWRNSDPNKAIEHVRAQPSPEAPESAWQRGFNDGVDTVIAAKNEWNYFPVDMNRIRGLKIVAPTAARKELP